MQNSYGSIYGMHRFWWALIILIALGLIFYVLDVQKKKMKKKNPLEELKERLAKGKISRREFEDLKKYLKEFN